MFSRLWCFRPLPVEGCILHKFDNCFWAAQHISPTKLLPVVQENLLVARPHQGDEAGDGAHHLLPWHRVALTGHRGVHQVHHATLLLVTEGRRTRREVGWGGHNPQHPPPTSTSQPQNAISERPLSPCRLLASYWQPSRRLDRTFAPLSPLRPARSSQLDLGVPEWFPLGDCCRGRCRHKLPTSEAAYSQRSLRGRQPGGGRTCSSHWIFTNLFPSSFPNLIFNQVRLGGQVCVWGAKADFLSTLATTSAHPLATQHPYLSHRAPSINRKALLFLLPHASHPSHSSFQSRQLQSLHCCLAMSCYFPFEQSVNPPPQWSSL